MKNILFLLSLLITLVGCEKYELETYPTLDGTYLEYHSVTMTMNDDQITNYNNSGETVWFYNC